MKSLGIVLNFDPEQGKDGILSLVKPNEDQPKCSSEIPSPSHQDDKLINMIESPPKNKRKLPKPFFSDTKTEDSVNGKKFRSDMLKQDDALFIDWSNLSSLHNRETSGFQITVSDFKRDQQDVLEYTRLKPCKSFIERQMDHNQGSDDQAQKEELIPDN